jgi:CrcB protein
MLKSILLVGLGGFIGSVGRYLVAVWLMKIDWQTPVATLFVNVLGSLLIGLIIASSVRNMDNLRLLLVTGFCGGFTTFSTFSLENLKLIEQGYYATSIQYILMSLLGGLLFVFLGYLAGTKLFV